MAKKSKYPSKAKAKKILKDGTVHGKALTRKQQKLFGFLAGGGKPTKTGKKK